MQELIQAIELVHKLGFTTNSATQEINSIITKLRYCINTYTKIKSDFEMMDRIYEWIHNKTTKQTICIAVGSPKQQVLETLLLYFDEIVLEKYNAVPLRSTRKIPAFRMEPIPKLNVTKISNSVPRKNRKEEKKKSTSTPNPRNNTSTVNKDKSAQVTEDRIKLYAVKPMLHDIIARFENYLLNSGKIESDLFVVKNKFVTASDANSTVITYYDEIDVAFERLVIMLTELPEATMQTSLYIVRVLLPETVYALCIVSPEIYDEILLKLKLRWFNSNQTDHRFVLLWIDHYYKENKQNQLDPNFDIHTF